jgi:radical SAM protein with 4Fe4S-binding SPASM domain
MDAQRAAKIGRYWPLVEGGRRGAPISLQVALTDSCFNRCIGCGHPMREQRVMGVSDWLSFLESLPVGVLESVCYSGGDPFAYHDFNKVMIWHIENAVEFGCTVTGYVPPAIDLNLLSFARFVRVSLDAIDPEVYAKVRGKTPLAKVLDGVTRMIAAGVKVGLGITLHPDNEGQLPKILQWAGIMGIADIDTRYAYPLSNPKWPDVDMGQRGVLPFKSCKAALYQLYIDSDGSVYPCCITAGDTRAKAKGYALGNIYVDEWRDVWREVVVYSELDISQLPDICRTCCVKRLSEINNLCGDLPLTNSFF